MQGAGQIYLSKLKDPFQTGKKGKKTSLLSANPFEDTIVDTQFPTHRRADLPTDAKAGLAQHTRSGDLPEHTKSGAFTAQSKPKKAARKPRASAKQGQPEKKKVVKTKEELIKRLQELRLKNQ
jgi:hypothetical protein